MTKKVLINYLTYSGNTEEVAELIGVTLKNKGYKVDLYDIYTNNFNKSLQEYDFILIGSFTWNQGYVPDEMIDFIKRYCDGLSGEKIHVFGTGDTQFGGMELYCLAVDKISKYFKSPYPTLKIEQSPRGSQEILVKDWVNNIVKRSVF